MDRNTFWKQLEPALVEGNTKTTQQLFAQQNAPLFIKILIADDIFDPNKKWNNFSRIATIGEVTLFVQAIPVLKAILETNKVSDQEKTDLLYDACFLKPNQSAAQLLLDHNANPNTPESYGNLVIYPLIKYSFKGSSLNMLTLLITYGLDLNQKTGEKCWNTPLHIAVENEYNDILPVHLLLDAPSIDITAIDWNYKTALDMAILLDKKDLIQLFRNKCSQYLSKDELTLIELKNQSYLVDRFCRLYKEGK